jgi:[ribosomal protein S18]-alanine N-acetyltransferase
MKEPNHEIILRDYGLPDYEGVMSLWEICGLSNKARGDSQHTIDETLKLGGRLLILESHGQIAGTSWITNDGRRLYLHHFGIHPDYRGFGLAHRLTTASLAFAEERNMQIKLEVHRTNTVAIELYKKHGFNYLGDYDVFIVREPGAASVFAGTG